MITLVRHGIEPLSVHAAVADMEVEAVDKLKGPVICKGARNTNDQDFNKKQKHAPHHISVETYWDKEPPLEEPTKVKGKG